MGEFLDPTTEFFQGFILSRPGISRRLKGLPRHFDRSRSPASDQADDEDGVNDHYNTNCHTYDQGRT